MRAIISKSLLFLAFVVTVAGTPTAIIFYKTMIITYFEHCLTSKTDQMTTQSRIMIRIGETPPKKVMLETEKPEPPNKEKDEWTIFGFGF